MKVTVWVRPAAARTLVGGEHGGALVVRVTARPVEGQATEAALAALAAAFRVRRRDVSLVTGAASRTKLVEITGGEQSRLDDLRNGSPRLI